MAGQPLFSNYMGLDPLIKAIGGSSGFGTKGHDAAQADAGVNALKGMMTPENSWYQQNFGLGGGVEDTIKQIYSKYYGREVDQPGADFWKQKAGEYQQGADPNSTADDKTSAEQQAWLLTHLLGRSDEFSNKYKGEMQSGPSNYKDKADWTGYRNNARQQTQALNNLPYTLDPGSLTNDKAANKALMFPAHLQPGGVTRNVIGGVNVAPAQDAANGYAGLISELGKQGITGDALSQVMTMVQNAVPTNARGTAAAPAATDEAAAAAAEDAEYLRQQRQRYEDNLYNNRD